MKDVETLRRKLRQAKNITDVTSLCESIGVSVTEINEHHFRLAKDGFRTLDYFPVTNKVNVFKTGKYEKVVSITVYILDYFNEP